MVVFFYIFMSFLNICELFVRQSKGCFTLKMGEKEWKILQEKMDKDRLRQDYKAKLVLTEQQCNQRIVSYFCPAN